MFTIIEWFYEGEEKNDSEFADYTIELFKNDDLWNSIRSNLVNLRGSKSWEISTIKFIESLK